MCELSRSALCIKPDTVCLFVLPSLEKVVKEYLFFNYTDVSFPLKFVNHPPLIQTKVLGPF